MNPAQQAQLARDTADAMLAEINKIQDLKARAVALRTLTVRMGPMAEIEVEAWAKEGPEALRNGLALTISRMMTQAERAAPLGAVDVGAIIGGITNVIGAVGGAVGGRVGAGITSAAQMAQALTDTARQLQGAVQQGGNPEKQQQAVNILYQAAQQSAQTSRPPPPPTQAAQQSAPPRQAPSIMHRRIAGGTPVSTTATGQPQVIDMQPQSLTAPSGVPAWLTPTVMIGAGAVAVLGVGAFLLLGRR